MEGSVLVSRRTPLPDPLRTARCLKAPEFGPRILFFSGGTAIRELSAELVHYTHNSIHLITPFDSGGSSAKLRAAFNMAAVGDLRNRIMALADKSVVGAPEVTALFAFRLPKDQTPEKLRERLQAMIAGRDPLTAAVPDPMRKIIRSHLQFFAERAPADFDLSGASIGNLILTGGRLTYQNRLDPVIYLFSKLVEARGIVRPVVTNDLHLAATLESGRTVVGQHLLTGKEAQPLTERVERLFLTDSKRFGVFDSPPPEKTVPIRKKTAELIATADLVCYPVGSLYSSVVASLLPKGAAEAVKKLDAPKVYIPNPYPDPEAVGLTVLDCVKKLLFVLNRDGGGGRALDYVLLDKTKAGYPGKIDVKGIEALGVKVIRADLGAGAAPHRIDPVKTAEILVSLA